jgi:hypothetical protein
MMRGININTQSGDNTWIFEQTISLHVHLLLLLLLLWLAICNGYTPACVTIQGRKQNLFAVFGELMIAGVRRELCNINLHNQPSVTRRRLKQEQRLYLISFKIMRIELVARDPGVAVQRAHVKDPRACGK